MEFADEITEVLASNLDLWDDFEIYLSQGGKCDYHTDNLKSIYTSERNNYELLDYNFMNKETYMKTVQANSGFTNEEFDDWIGENGKVVVFLLKYK